jgi:hypothetical protein
MQNTKLRGQKGKGVEGVSIQKTLELFSLYS